MKKICIYLDDSTEAKLRMMETHCRKEVRPHNRDAVTRSAVIRTAIAYFYDCEPFSWEMPVDEVLEKRWHG